MIGKKELRTHGLDETVKAINEELRLYFLLLCSFFIFLLKFSSSISFSQIFWKFSLLLFNQKYGKLRNQNKAMRIALMMTLFIFFTKVILSTFINTERITLDRGRRIDSISDLRRANLTLTFSDQFYCEEAVQSRMDSLKGIKIGYNEEKVQAVEILKTIKSKDPCALMESYLIDYMVFAACTFAEPGEIFFERIHKSRESLISRAHVLYFHRTIDEYAKKNTISWAYANIEGGIYSMVSRFGLKSFELAKTVPNMGCTQSRENKPVAEPLAIKFVLSFFRFQGLINILASLIFC